MAAHYTTRETSARCLTDMYLRSQGYRIMSRPKDGEPWWIRNGIAYPESEAIQRTLPEPNPAPTPPLAHPLRN
jgi:hypothetical protein